jgi:type IV fimbrial biogenesis protein FimT
MRKDAPGPAPGFSLVELLASTAVLAILLGLALPAFRQTLERQRAGAAMHQLAAQLAQARNTAISRRSPVTLCPSAGDGLCLRGTDWSQGWLLYRDPGRRDQPRRPEDILREVQSPFHDSIRVSTTAGRLRLRYQPNGRSGGSNLTLKICAGGELRGEIVVNNVGRARSRRLVSPLPCPAS